MQNKINNLELQKKQCVFAFDDIYNACKWHLIVKSLKFLLKVSSKHYKNGNSFEFENKNTIYFSFRLSYLFSLVFVQIIDGSFQITSCRFLTNSYLREESPNSHVVEQRVEW